MNTHLEKHLYQDILEPTEAELGHAITYLKDKAANSKGIAAILLYGSGLWQGPSDDKVWDLHVLVDDIGDFDRRLWHRVAGRLLPPNVYYFEQEDKKNIWRYKCNVMSLQQFRKQCQGKSLTPHIWARFCQPCRVIYYRDEESKKQTVTSLAQAIIKFHHFALPFCEKDNFAPRHIWETGLKKTYSLELRSESGARPSTIYNANPENFTARTNALLVDLGEWRFDQFQNDSQWGTKLFLVYKPLVKLLGFFRLIKSATTFENGVDYALWKIERHSGISITPTDRQRKYPLLFGWPLVWKLWRKGALK